MRIVNNLLRDIFSVFKKPSTEVVQKPIEYKLKQRRVYPGQSVFRMNIVTGEISEVTDLTRIAVFGRPLASLRQTLMMQAGYRYVIALNLRNAKKKFLSQ